MPSARIVVAVLCTRRPGKQHHIGYHGNSRAENETILHASLRECKQVGGLTRLMCSRYVGQRPNCSTIDPPSERAMPAAAAVTPGRAFSCFCSTRPKSRDQSPSSPSVSSVSSVSPVSSVLSSSGSSGSSSFSLPSRHYSQPSARQNLGRTAAEQTKKNKNSNR